MLNCYSCPGALGSCPIGAMQAIIGGAKYNVSFYVLGFLMLFGVTVGRLVCGFLCPFGLIQDLLFRIPIRKIRVPEFLDRIGRYLKYGMLVVFVLLLPILVTNPYGSAPPFFCEYFCPAGTLQGGIPLLLMDRQLRALAGVLFTWKMLILITMVVGSMLISRFFCRYFCPLGAFYSIFNRVSLYQMQLNRMVCTGCKSCEKACPMGIEVTRDINHSECIRCGKCKAACPEGAICSGLDLQRRSYSKDRQG